MTQQKYIRMCIVSEVNGAISTIVLGPIVKEIFGPVDIKTFREMDQLALKVVQP